MGTVRVEALGSLAAVAPLREAMDALNLASRRPDPFSTFEYLQAFLAHDEYGVTEKELLFLAGYDGRELVGYLALRRFKERLYGVQVGRLGLMVTHDTDRPHVVARELDEPRVCAAFYAYLLRERGWSLLELVMQDAHSGLAGLPHLNPLRFTARTFENMPNTTLPLPWPNIGEYLKALEKRERHENARHARKLFSAGKVEHVASYDPRARLALFEIYLDIERRSWKEAAHAGVRRSPRRVDFFRALCAADQPFALGVELVLLDDVPIAGLVLGSFDGRLYAQEAAFDEAYSELGPGRLGFTLSIKRAIDRHFESYNFGGNYAYYKSRLGGEVTPTSAVQIYRVGRLPWLKARAGELERRFMPPPPNDQRFNADKRRLQSGSGEEQAPGLPDRASERELWHRTLAVLTAQGVALERLGGAELERALPYSGRRDAA